VPNANPIALDVFASTHAGTTVNLFADASDPDNDPISITSIGHTVSGHGNDYRVASASDAQQLLWDAYDATAYGRLPLRRPGTDEWQAGRYEFGHHFDTDYEAIPEKTLIRTTSSISGGRTTGGMAVTSRPTGISTTGRGSALTRIPSLREAGRRNHATAYPLYLQKEFTAALY